MTQDNAEYVFYEKRRMEEEMKTLPNNDEKADFLVGERATARKRKIRLEEEAKKLGLLIGAVKEMEADLND